MLVKTLLGESEEQVDESMVGKSESSELIVLFSGFWSVGTIEIRKCQFNSSAPDNCWETPLLSVAVNLQRRP